MNDSEPDDRPWTEDQWERFMIRSLVEAHIEELRSRVWWEVAQPRARQIWPLSFAHAIPMYS